MRHKSKQIKQYWDKDVCVQQVQIQHLMMVLRALVLHTQHQI